VGPDLPPFGQIASVGVLHWAYHEHQELDTDQEGTLLADEVRAVIANHLGVGIENVRDEAHFKDDLGADWLDRVELMIAIVDGVESTDDQLGQMEVVGDLIRCVEEVAGARPGRCRGTPSAALEFSGPRKPPSSKLI
jgi:acyl carrier protein